jgi:hypothetical protein
LANAKQQEPPLAQTARSFDRLVGTRDQSNMDRKPTLGHEPHGRNGAAIKERHTSMSDDIPLPFELPAVARKKVSAAFDGGPSAMTAGNGFRSALPILQGFGVESSECI